jgi:hypothetical protein
MQNELVTDADLKKSEKLHTTYEQAKAAREAAEPQLRELQLKFEDCAMRLEAAERSPGSSPGRIAELKTNRDAAEVARDKARKAADAPLIQSRDLIKNFDGKILTAAGAWIGYFRKFDDESLDKFVSGVLREFDSMRRNMRPLSEIVACFNAARDRLESWELPRPQSKTFTGKIFAKVWEIPRLSDFLK